MASCATAAKSGGVDVLGHLDQHPVRGHVEAQLCCLARPLVMTVSGQAAALGGVGLDRARARAL
jgi:hypothetical protein